jgi:hypothetical protein
MFGIIAHRIAYRVYREVQGGLEHVPHSLIIGNSFLKPVAESLSDSLDRDEVNALSVEAAFT